MIAKHVKALATVSGAFVLFSLNIAQSCHIAIPRPIDNFYRFPPTPTDSCSGVYRPSELKHYRSSILKYFNIGKPDTTEICYSEYDSKLKIGDEKNIYKLQKEILGHGDTPYRYKLCKYDSLGNLKSSARFEDKGILNPDKSVSIEVRKLSLETSPKTLRDFALAVIENRIQKFETSAL